MNSLDTLPPIPLSPTTSFDPKRTISLMRCHGGPDARAKSSNEYSPRIQTNPHHVQSREVTFGPNGNVSVVHLFESAHTSLAFTISRNPAHLVRRSPASLHCWGRAEGRGYAARSSVGSSGDASATLLEASSHGLSRQDTVP